MKNRNIEEILFFFSMIFIMVISLNLAVMDYTGVDLPFARMIIFTLITIAAASFILIFPITLLAVLVSAIFGALYLYYNEPSLINHYMQEILEFFNWLYGYVVGYNYFEPGYSLLFSIIYISLTTFVVSLIVYSGRRGFVLIAIGTAALSFFWFIYVEKARLYLMLFLFAAIILYSYQIYKKRLREW